MWDPIVAEIHRTRQEIFARFDNDMTAYVRHIRELEDEQRERGRRIVSAPLRGHRKAKPDAA